MTRKNYLEGNLIIFSDEPTIILPEYLYNMNNNINDELQISINNSNIYLIAKRNRISFCPQRVFLNSGVLSLVIQSFDSTGINIIDEDVFHFPLNFIPEQVRISPFPHKELILKIDGKEVIHNINQIVAKANLKINTNLGLEVMYVGQAFGNNGERNALDRLSSHSTFQKILVEMRRHEPLSEIFILLYSFGWSKRMLTSDGCVQYPIDKPIDEDFHWNNIMNMEISRKNRIALAEAGLIRYFMPKYNEDYKNTFPSKKHEILKEALDLDFTDLTVEISSANMNVQLYTNTQSQHNVLQHEPFVHIAKFPLYNQNERDCFLHKFL